MTTTEKLARFVWLLCAVALVAWIAALVNQHIGAIARFLSTHVLLFIASVWLIGGSAMAWFERRAGMEDV